MKIDELPIEILMDIFSYLPAYDEVVLVNSRFYEVVCKVMDPKICIEFHNRLLTRKWLPSITNTTRKISKLDFCLPNEQICCQIMITIIEFFTRSIKCLKITGAGLTMLEFLEILRLIPNVEHLILEELKVRYDGAYKRRRLLDDDLNLYKLKKLQFTGRSVTEKDEFLEVFDRLPVGVLTDLELTRFQLNEVVVLFKRQTNITKLKMIQYDYNDTHPVPIYDNLQLQSFTISGNRPSDIATLLSNQRQLKTLALPFKDTNRDSMNFIAGHATELETLSIKISTALPPSCIANIGKLKKLKNFLVWLHYDMTIAEVESLARYSNFGVTSLGLNHKCLNVNVAQALAKSLTKLKVLKLFCYGDINDKVINAIMTNFNFIEVLHIRGGIDGNKKLCDGDWSNPKLTELIVPLPTRKAGKWLRKLIAHYPNLKKFQIDFDAITSSQFREILNGFTKLESLTFIDSAVKLTEDDLYYLMAHKNNLKFISLDRINVTFTDELKRQLNNVFGVISINEDSECILAVDRHTMNHERRLEEKALSASVF